MAATAGALCIATGSAAAKPRSPLVVTAPTDMVIRHISYADLDLATRAGERTLNHRVTGAVRDVCTEALGGRDASFTFKIGMMNCDNDAWGQASPQIAQAVQRAREIAQFGSSQIAAAAVVIRIGQ